MALTATPYRFLLSLADVDRGVYEELDLLIALHPSESPEHLVARLLALALEYRPGIAFSPGGISNGDEPAVAVRDPSGRYQLWVDVGAPAPERLHRAAKAAEEVAVYTVRNGRRLADRLTGRGIHRATQIRLAELPRAVVEGIAKLLERRLPLTLTVSGGELLAAVGPRFFQGAMVHHPIAP
jgi:uncharacterized protein YaeQ